MELSVDEMVDVLKMEVSDFLVDSLDVFNPVDDMNAAWLIARKFRLCVVPFEDMWTAFEEGRWQQDSVKHLHAKASMAIILAGMYYSSNPYLPEVSEMTYGADNHPLPNDDIIPTPITASSEDVK